MQLIAKKKCRFLLQYDVQKILKEKKILENVFQVRTCHMSSPRLAVVDMHLAS